MPVTQNDLDWFAARLMIIVYDVNREFEMSAQVKSLAETVRNAKAAIDAANGAADRLRSSADRVTSTIEQVDGMTKQLDNANTELTAALGQLSNGGPPLDDTSSSGGTTPAGSGDPIASSLHTVQVLNTTPGNNLGDVPPTETTPVKFV